MAVKSYQNKFGETLWIASVCLYSKVNSGLRVQKSKFCLLSERDAQKELNNLIREAERELSKVEHQGSTWGRVVDDWELFLRKDASISESTRTDYINSLFRYTQDWWHQSASEITPADVVELMFQLKAKGASNSFQSKMKTTISRAFTFGMQKKMKICGWKDLESMRPYIRLAGIEIEGATESLRLLPDNEVMVAHDQDFIHISQWMGHPSIERTWKNYKSKRVTHYRML